MTSTLIYIICCYSISNRSKISSILNRYYWF
nr:MAG TPA: hypothetical protein [Bacteriophage sp.]DAW98726.1 MAG TPA: hypothetical protein [Caudoviricetes sp.]DAX15178.1 MAG TPA: hypothetical protein [Bacteriophage sp.]